MLEIVDQPSTDPVDRMASEAIATLYEGIAGAPALSVRAYRDDDAILVLLRFDARAMRLRDLGLESPVEVAMLAIPDFVAAIVLERTGARLLPGSVSVSTLRGLAVFGFSVLDADAPLVVDLFGSGLPPAG